MRIAKSKVNKQRALVSEPFVFVRTGHSFSIPQKISMAKRQDVTSVKSPADQSETFFWVSDCSGDLCTIWLLTCRRQACVYEC